MYENLKELFQKYVPLLIDRIFEGNIGAEEPVAPLSFITPRTNLNLVKQLTVLLDALIPPENPPQEPEPLEKLYLFCLVWSLGGTLTAAERGKFDDYLKKNTGILNPAYSFFDTVIEMANPNYSWNNWVTKVEEYSPPPDNKFSKILVPTVDTVRYSWLLEKVMALKRKPVMFVGDSGTAKSVTIFS